MEGEGGEEREGRREKEKRKGEKKLRIGGKK
jgi:hypothetical protein